MNWLYRLLHLEQQDRTLLEQIVAYSRHNSYLLWEIQRKMAANQAQLDAALAQIEAIASQAGTDILKAIADLQAKIAAGSTAADLQPEVDRLTALGTSLSELDAKAVAADQA